MLLGPAREHAARRRPHTPGNPASVEQRITSLQNPRLNLAAKLRERKGRETQNRFLIDGLREIERALNAGVSFDEVFLRDAADQYPQVRQLLQEFQTRGIRIIPVSARAFAKLAYGEKQDGLVAVAHTVQESLADFVLPPQCLVAVLVGIEKPGNIGAILRCADGAGVNAVIVADGPSDLLNPNTIRASLGTIFAVPCFATSKVAAIAWLQQHRFEVYAARVDAKIRYDQVQWHERSALVLGSEAEGLDATWNRPDVTPIGLPMLGIADSLNVAATAAVLFYDQLRQRSNRPQPK